MLLICRPTTALLLVGCLSMQTTFAQGYSPTPESECTTVRLDQSPRMLATVPVRDQGDLNVCGSHVASQLLAAIENSQGRSVRSDRMASPVALSIDYAAKNSLDHITRLSLRGLMEELGRGGVVACPASLFEDRLPGNRTSELLNNLYVAFNDYQGQGTTSSQAVQKANTALERAGFSARVQEATLRLPHVNNFLQRVVGMECDSKRLVTPRFEVESLYAVSFGSRRWDAINAFTAKLNMLLADREAAPVGINFCRTVFTSPESSGVLSDGTLSNNVGCKDNNHYGVVVGRRLLHYKAPSSGETKAICQFLVRDSYGPSCKDFPADTTATPSETCEGGQIWVDENSLAANIGELVWLKPRH